MRPLEITSEEFRRLAGEVTEMSAQFLSSMDARPIFPATSGAEAERLFSEALPERGLGAQALAALKDVAAHARAQNGRFFGYVQGAGEPVAALGDLAASILNQNMTAWRSSPSGVTIERTVVRWLAEAVGCRGFFGTLTGGGSAANLMGLTMAREAKTPANERGLHLAPLGVVYASEQVHMAVPKAVAMIGIGRQNLRTIPCDESYRMIPSKAGGGDPQGQEAGHDSSCRGGIGGDSEYRSDRSAARNRRNCACAWRVAACGWRVRSAGRDCRTREVRWAVHGGLAVARSA